MRKLFEDDPERPRRYSLTCDDLFLDYSRNRADDETMRLLARLAEEAELPEWRRRLFAGEIVNTSERAPALHPALRDSGEGPAAAAARADAAALRRDLYAFCEDVRAGRRVGASGAEFTDVVNLGIGGSHLGPAAACRALARFGEARPQAHFVSGVDARRPLPRALDPRSVLFVVTSKSFRTPETLASARHARDWLCRHYGDDDSWRAHFIAATAKPELARAFGLPPEHCFPMWDAVGGRYSLWSAAGLPLLLRIGARHYQALLDGARRMDEHFATAPLLGNMPVIMALLGVWYAAFNGAATQAVLPYDAALALLPAHLQQLHMESNGKSVDRDGEPAGAAAPIVWGGLGLEGQHAYYQLLHQGAHLVPCDFIIAGAESGEFALASLLAQGQALMRGCEAAEPHRRMPGERPSNAVVMKSLTPRALGMLMALYEHKVFSQAVIWRVNPFDQWGVEFGKTLAERLLPGVRGEPCDAADAAARALLRKCRDWDAD